MLRLDTWRRQNAIPESVYAKIVPASPAADPGTMPSKDELDVAAGVVEGAGSVSGFADDDETAETDAPTQGDVASSNIPSVARSDALPASTKHVTETTPARASVPPRERSSRDWSKPQFINFASPLLVSLFARLPGMLKGFTLILEECYPDVQSFPTFDGEQFACELIVQIDTPATQRLEDNPSMRLVEDSVVSVDA
jgi:hypothetical protein